MESFSKKKKMKANLQSDAATNCRTWNKHRSIQPARLGRIVKRSSKAAKKLTANFVALRVLTLAAACVEKSRRSIKFRRRYALFFARYASSVRTLRAST
jgi:hypothetical protein